jgi:hypothetical protein
MPATGNKSFTPLSLSIRLRADGFSFYVCDVQSNSLIRGEHFAADANVPIAQQLQRELSKPEYFNRQIDQAYILVCTPSTHVPLEAFRRDEATELFAFTFPQEAVTSNRVAYTILPELESVELFSIDRDVEDVILQYYPTARFFASRSMLLERLLRYDDDIERSGRNLYCCISGEGIIVAQIEKGRIKYANTFAETLAPNIQYYVLNVWQMLGLDAETDHLVVIADEAYSEQKALCQGFELYLRNIDSVASSDLFPNVALARERNMPVDLKALLLNRL